MLPLGTRSGPDSPAKEKVDILVPRFFDAAGNFYGTTYSDGAYGRGSVFKLTPSNSGWTYTSLHDFTFGADGGYPFSNVVLDSEGNLYGTASKGGSQNCGGGCGVVREITP